MEPMFLNGLDPDDRAKTMAIINAAKYKMLLLFKPNPKTGKMMVNLFFGNDIKTDELINYLGEAIKHLTNVKDDITGRKEKLARSLKASRDSS